MFEIYVQSDRGWEPLNCGCPAGRAAFRDEHAAQAAISRHVAGCPDAVFKQGASRVFVADAA